MKNNNIAVSFFITELSTNEYLLLRNMIIGIIGSFGPEKEPDPGFGSQRLVPRSLNLVLGFLRMVPGFLRYVGLVSGFIVSLGFFRD